MPNKSVWKFACSLLAAVIAVVGLAPAAWAAKRSPKPRPPDPLALLAKQTLDAFHGADFTPVAQVASGGAVFSALSDVTAADAYVLLRSHLATVVASRLQSTTAEALDAAWGDASPERMLVILSALSQVGTRYRWGNEQPGVGFDCSGLTQWSWAQVAVTLPRSAWSQIHSVVGRTAAQLEVGDLVYHVEHVSLYLGAGHAVIDAPQTGKYVDVKDWRRETRFGNPLG